MAMILSTIRKRLSFLKAQKILAKMASALGHAAYYIPQNAIEIITHPCRTIFAVNKNNHEPAVTTGNGNFWLQSVPCIFSTTRNVKYRRRF